MRGYERRKLAKKLLLKVINERFALDLKEHQKALGYFINRRGYSYIDSSFNIDTLSGINLDFLKEHDFLKFLKPFLLDSYFDIEAFKNKSQIESGIGELKTLCNNIDCLIAKNNIKRAIKNRKINLSNNDISFLNKELGESFKAFFSKNDYKTIKEEIKDFNGIKTKNLINLINKDIKHEYNEIIPKSIQEDNPNRIIKIEEGILTESAKDTDILQYIFICFKLTLDEISKGAKHRSIYFKNIEKDIKGLKNRKEKYLKNFYIELLKLDKDENKSLDIFYRLTSHINNLDLRFSRAALSTQNSVSKKHKPLNDRLTFLFNNTIINKWRVTAEKDGKKKLEEHQELLKYWKENKDEGAIGFWLTTEPKLTIPPYESRTNHNPPICNTLLLNEDYLNKNYKDWQYWLNALEDNYHDKDTLNEYKSSLNTPKSKKGTSLITTKVATTEKSDNNLKLRTLLFILDTNKSLCNFKINEVWGLHRKIFKIHKTDNREYKRFLEKYNNLLETSKMPNELKETFSLKGSIDYKKGSFAHFINKYYNDRRKTKDSRYFIHFNTNKRSRNEVLTENKLFSLCPHKPKQKRHQAICDVLALFGCDDNIFKDIIKDNEPTRSLENFFTGFRGFKSNCERLSKIQKEIGSYHLKNDINNEKTDSYKVFKTLEKISKNIIKELNCNNEHIKKRFSDIFLYAQLNNILFTDRSGFSTNCPVCSVDNGFRNKISDNKAIASRLNSLKINLIDGAVKKLLTHKSHHLINNIWPAIKNIINSGDKVHIPIILEQNRFSFTPELKDLKGSGNSHNTKNIDDINTSKKEERIKRFTRKICPYTGDNLTEGDIDHILPRKSKYGILNDEANLIFASRKGNQIKSNKTYYLKDLDKKYLLNVFKSHLDDINENNYIEEIKQKIENTISDSFRYKGFLQLSDLEKVCVKHALFLDEESIIRKNIIEQLQHFSKTSVNGTQRYMAQVISDIIYKKVKKINKVSNISFDFFEYDAFGDKKNVKDIRKMLEGVDADLGRFKKEDNKKQENYSHLIDAMAAFILAANDHQGDGSLKINLEGVDIYPIDSETGEFKEKNLFNLIKIDNNNLKTISVAPRSLVKKLKERKDCKKININDVISRETFKEKSAFLYNPIVLNDNNALILRQSVRNDNDSLKTKTIKNSELKTLIETGYYKRTTNSKNPLIKDNKEVYIANRKLINKDLFNLLDSLKNNDIDFKDNKNKALKYIRKNLVEFIERQTLDTINNKGIRSFNHKKHKTCVVDIEKPLKTKTLSSPTLFNRTKDFNGNEHYQVLIVDSNIIAKENLGLIIKGTRNSVLFAADIKNGMYSYCLEEKETIDLILNTDEFLEDKFLKENKTLEGKKARLENTSLTFSLDKSIFLKNLLINKENTHFKNRFTLEIKNEDKAKTNSFIKKEALKYMLKDKLKSFRDDITLKIDGYDNEVIEIKIPYKYENTLKIKNIIHKSYK